MSHHANIEPLTGKKVQGALLARSVKSPLVLYPSVTAGLGAFAGALFGFNLVLGAILLGGVTLAAGGFLTEFGFRREKNVKSILLEANREMERERQHIIDVLHEEIDDETLPNARNQLIEFKTKFDTFVDVLDDRFVPGELTFIRYLSVAEQVYLSGLDNLRNAVISCKAIQSTDPEELNRRLNQLQDTRSDTIERAALTDRLRGYEETRTEIGELLVLNEKALAVLDNVTQKIARTQVNKGMADGDTESAVGELQRMGALLARYVKS
jgi:hypothetical protein